MPTILFPPGLYIVTILMGLAAGGYTVYTFMTGKTEVPTQLRLQMFFIIFVCFLFAILGLFLPTPIDSIIWLIESFVLSVVGAVIFYITFLDHYDIPKSETHVSNALAELPAPQVDPVEAKIIDILKKNRK